MRSRLLTVAGLAMALGLITAAPGAAQGPTPPKAPATVQRTPWGDPDIQGVWSFDSEAGVPFERPQALGTKAAVAESELEEFLEEREAERAERAPTLGGITGAGPTHWFEDWGQKSNRTSLVIDPADGRVPALTPVAQARQRAGGQGGGGTFGNGPFNSFSDFTNWDRCITRGKPNVMFPTIYNNNTRITQGPGYVAITYEMIHETDIVPVDGRAHLPENLRQWLGNARGHWEGDTLVIETTNFTDRTNYRGATSTLKVIERYTPVPGKGLRYEMTVDDPKTFTRKWTAALNLTPSVDMFEYACHEGNYAIKNVLSGARAAEKAQGAAR
jgi:hypothetical protein